MQSSGHWILDARPEAVALISGSEAVTYAELAARALGVGARLAARVSPGAPVGLDLPAGIDFVAALHACLLIGSPAVPIDRRLAGRERAAVLDSVHTTVGVQDLQPAGVDRAVPRAPDDDRVAVILHTSGTTGTPRPIALTRANVLANARALAAAMQLGAQDRWLCPLPLSHVGGLMVPLRCSILAATAVLGSAEQIGGDATVASLVPTQLVRLLDDGVVPGIACRQILLGGAAQPPALLARAAQAGYPVRPSYGMTEACSTVAIAEIGATDARVRPLPGVEVEIIDGEIVLGGPSIVSPPLHSGDLGRLDVDGLLSVVGRRDEMIISGGENVAPAEVEAVLAAHPAVSEVAVFGRADPEWGQAIIAVVVVGVQVSEDELRSHCQARLARFKVPKGFEFLDALPRTSSGKVRRAELT